MNIPIFLINLDSDSTRLKFMMHQFAFLDITDSVTRIPAVDMRKASMNQIIKHPNISLFTKFTIQKKHRCDHKQIDSTGAIGSTLSHYKVWKHIIDKNIEMALVMEDDMRLMLEFPKLVDNEIQKYKNKFDMLNLGFHKNLYSEVENTKFFFNAGCYVITKRGCEILCKHAFPIEVHVDAYFFLLNHFGIFNMVLSNEVSVTPQNGVQTNIDHGTLKCNDSNNEIVIYQKSQTNSIGIVVCFVLLLSVLIHAFLHFRKN
jgi:GR25 family glycosyltransferase involved in LPS biosynthesis